MINRSLIFLFSILLAPIISAQTIDAEKSVVNFKSTALMVNTVHGTFKGMHGEINFDENNLANSSFDVCIKPSSVNTGIQKRDDHLRSEDFFFVEQFPEICFVSGSIEKTKSGYKTTGKLTMHGISNEVKIPFTFENNTFTGELKIKRLDYNIGEEISSFTASKEAKIEIICVLK